MYDDAALVEWALTHPSPFDDVVRALAHFTDSDDELVVDRVDQLRQQAHAAIDNAAASALARYRQDRLKVGWR